MPHVPPRERQMKQPTPWPEDLIEEFSKICLGLMVVTESSQGGHFF